MATCALGIFFVSHKQWPYPRDKQQATYVRVSIAMDIMVSFVNSSQFS